MFYWIQIFKHDEFVIVNNIIKDYFDMKKEIKIPMVNKKNFEIH